MSLQENLEAAQAAADVANANLLAAQQAYNEAQPHLSVLFEIEVEAGKLEGEAQIALMSLVAKARSLF